MHNRRFTALVLLVPSLIGSLTTALAAQRVDAEFSWQENKITLSYGAARFGKRSLKDLPVGSNWRMGQNDATTLETSLPLVGARSPSGVRAPSPWQSVATNPRRWHRRAG